MNFLTKKNPTTIKLFSIFFIWLVYNGTYLALGNNASDEVIAGYFALVGQGVLDIGISFLAFKLYMASSNPTDKSTYLFFFLSAVSATMADCIYHSTMNILGAEYFNLANSFFEIPFIFFLLFQGVAWYKTFFNQFNNLEVKKFAFLPYLIASIFIFFSFVYVVPWKINYLSLLGKYQLIDTFLEVIGFALCALCLTRAQTNSMRLLSIGYLLIISSDLLIRCKVVLGVIPSLSPFEVTWNFGLLLMALGFFYIKKKPNINLLPLNCLQSYISIWLLNLLLLFVVSLLYLNYFFPDQKITHYFLWMTIPFTLMAIVASKFFASKILFPLKRLEAMIKEFLNEGIENYSRKIERLPLHIDDFMVLENFIHDSFELYKKNHLNEMEYNKSATQVAHDIQSPLLALNNYFEEALKIDNNKCEIIKSSLNRINEIANNLLLKYKNKEIDCDVNHELELISFIFQSLIEEKKLQFKNSNVQIVSFIENNVETAFVAVNCGSFKRTLSNLINNAVESINGEGIVTVSLRKQFNNILLEIKDTGCGIPLDILNSIDQRKTNKLNGHGLGLSSAFKSIGQWNAQYEIETKENEGTTFKITFPIQPAPDWFQESLPIYSDLDVIIVDDDYSIFKIWEDKILQFENNNVQLTYLSSPEELLKFVNISSRENKLFLIDYEFNNSNVTGINLIKNLNLDNSVLVTNKYPDKSLRLEIQENSIHYLFKKHLFLTKIQLIYDNPELILVDDSKIIAEVWMLEAKKHNEKIVVFNSKSQLMRHLHLFKKNIPLYIDLNLGKENGSDLAQFLFMQGFHQLYITTGENLTKINPFPWILDIHNKEPPFSKSLTEIKL